MTYRFEITMSDINRKVIKVDAVEGSLAVIRKHFAEALKPMAHLPQRGVKQIIEALLESPYWGKHYVELKVAKW